MIFNSINRKALEEIVQPFADAKSVSKGGYLSDDSHVAIVVPKRALDEIKELHSNLAKDSSE